MSGHNTSVGGDTKPLDFIDMTNIKLPLNLLDMTLEVKKETKKN